MHTVIRLQPESDRPLFEGAMAFARRQLRVLIERYPDFYPMYTMAGKWKHSGEAWTHWCDGFLGGMLWIVYAQLVVAGDPEARWWRDQAIQYSKPLEPRRHDRNVHDLGFIFMSTYYRWFKSTKEPGLKSVIVEAGRTMAMRFQEKGAYLRSFV